MREDGLKLCSSRRRLVSVSPINLILGAVTILLLARAFWWGSVELRWLGARSAVLSVVVLAFVVSIAGPIVAIVSGAPVPVVLALLVGPALLLTMAMRPLVRYTGGLRPEVEILDAYRRIDRVNRGKPGTPKMPKADEVITAAINQIEALRTPSTAALVDAIVSVGQPWVAGEVLDDVEWNRRKSALWTAAERAWGREWVRRL